MLSGRRIVLGISGGVAAYKAAYLARRITEAGAAVRCVMTEAATEFVGAQTLAAITGEFPVLGFFDEADVSPHTALGQWSEAMVIAPATAGTIAKLATGLSDNALIATAMMANAKAIRRKSKVVSLRGALPPFFLDLAVPSAASSDLLSPSAINDS